MSETLSYRKYGIIGAALVAGAVLVAREGCDDEKNVSTPAVVAHLDEPDAGFDLADVGLKVRYALSGKKDEEERTYMPPLPPSEDTGHPVTSFDDFVRPVGPSTEDSVEPMDKSQIILKIFDTLSFNGKKINAREVTNLNGVINGNKIIVSVTAETGEELLFKIYHYAEKDGIMVEFYNPFRLFKATRTLEPMNVTFYAEMSIGGSQDALRDILQSLNDIHSLHAQTEQEVIDLFFLKLRHVSPMDPNNVAFMDVSTSE